MIARSLGILLRVRRVAAIRPACSSPVRSAEGVSKAAVPQVTRETRTYAALPEITREVGDARIWGGLHYRKAMVDTYEMGHRTAARALSVLD